MRCFVSCETKAVERLSYTKYDTGYDIYLRTARSGALFERIREQSDDIKAVDGNCFASITHTRRYHMASGGPRPNATKSTVRPKLSRHFFYPAARLVCTGPDVLFPP